MDMEIIYEECYNGGFGRSAVECYGREDKCEDRCHGPGVVPCQE